MCLEVIILWTMQFLDYFRKAQLKQDAFVGHGHNMGTKGLLWRHQPSNTSTSQLGRCRTAALLE